MAADQAADLAHRLMADQETALGTLAREELSIDPEELGGSPMQAAATSFLLFAVGASLPVLPFAFSSGPAATTLSLGLGTLGLFLLGAAITLFTGRSVLFSGLPRSWWAPPGRGHLRRRPADRRQPGRIAVPRGTPSPIEDPSSSAERVRPASRAAPLGLPLRRAEGRRREPGSDGAGREPAGTPLGFALWSSRSEIRLRMVERGDALPDDFWRARIERALRWRETVAAGPRPTVSCTARATACPRSSSTLRRLPRHPDAFPGDGAREAGDRRCPDELLRPQAFSNATTRGSGRWRGSIRVSVLSGEVPEAVEVSEATCASGRPARDRRRASSSTSGRTTSPPSLRSGRALDCFSYDGGFALQLARQCDGVVAVDLSEESLQRAKANGALNGITNLTTRNANVFDLLRSFDDSGERFDTVILDPPAFAKSRDAVEKAVRGYKEINLRALKVLNAGGCLVTCSCSHHVHEDDFEAILTDAAADAGVAVTIVEKRRQARDHPVLLGVPETYYLKCFVLRKLG